MPPPHPRDWIDYVLAVAPFLALLVAIGVGVMQAHLQKKNLNQSLFDKRYKVYAAVGQYLTQIIGVIGATDTEVVTAFQSATAHAEFLFGQDVVEFIDRVNEKALLLRHFQALVQAHNNAYLEFQRGVADPERPNIPMSVLNDAQSDLLKSLIQAQSDMNRNFRRYLKLHDDRSWRQQIEEHLDKQMKEREGAQVE
jgi:hypothetical protein